MKNVACLKPNKVESPKTPGGISKSLLTPCRRVGLSRNWRKGGPSPFVSPLSGNDDKQEKDTRKRKECDENISKVEENPTCSEGIDKTPSRISAPRKKKSKILSDTNNSEPNTPVTANSDIKDKNVTEYVIPRNDDLVTKINSQECIEVVTPVLKSKSNIKKFVAPSNTSTEKDVVDVNIKETEIEKLKEKKKSIKNDVKEDQISPENLTKECIVVIQKKIFKKDLRNDKTKKDCPLGSAESNKQTTSQALFDSDSDELPLCQINEKNKCKDPINTHKKHQNEESTHKEHINEKIPQKDQSNDKNIHKARIQPKVLVLEDDDDDFVEKKEVKIKKLEDKTTSTGSLKKAKKKVKEKHASRNITEPMKETWSVVKPSSQSSIDDDDVDFAFDKKKTILIRKCYDKVSKPAKAKSTGSITQKDIDDLKSRIEIKKKLLVAKAMTKDTEELRDLIKKWQRGCQDALMELMELMRNKFPDKQNMDYSEMLQTLRIPSSLVGFDAENDCFNTPDDASIILSNFNDL